MEAYSSQQTGLKTEISNVFSEDFICGHIINYFKRNGYKVSRDKGVNLHGREEKLIIASKLFRKEIVEVKGCPLNGHPGPVKDGKVIPIIPSKSSISEMLLSSLISLGNFYREDNITISMAIPNVPRYKAIIERLHSYFTVNQLYFRVYLVDENGDVEVLNLNNYSVPNDTGETL